MPLITKNLDGLKAKLSECRTITLVCHTRPDGDAMGSVLGLYHVLKEAHEVSIIVPSEYPEFLAWMPGIENVIVFSEETEDVCDEVLNDTELLFCLDFSGLNRVGNMEALITGRSCEYVMIDHHLDPHDFDTYRFWNNDAAATCQLIYQLLETWGMEDTISQEAATCLFTGILTDTGSFRFSNTTAEVHRIAAKLIDKGAENSVINDKLFSNNSETRLRLLGHLLANRLTILRENKTAYILVKEEDHKNFDIQSGDTEGVVNFALSLDGIIFASLISWSEEYVKLSLRSKGEFPANEIASKYFNGGGHRNASGGRFDGTIAETEKQFLAAVNDFTEVLDKEYIKFSER